jgi:flavin reductase (DIM6/NTAB) family NADH-FMN oxidoreductase RutF
MTSRATAAAVSVAAVTESAAFNELVGELDYPMFIVTVAGAAGPAGCLVGFATQTSIDPSRFLVCLSRANHTTRVAADAERVAVHFVPDIADDLAELFGGETGDEVDKFARCAWHRGPHALPILDACRNWFVGRVVERIDLGDHVGHLLVPEVSEHGATGPDFTFHRAQRIAPGHPA